MRVLVTRPQAQADDWVARLQALGLDAVGLPLLGIAPPPNDQDVLAAWGELPRLTLVVFVSPNAVEQFFRLRPPGHRWPAGLLAAGTGPGTAAALVQAGVPAPQVVCPAADAPQFDSEALWQLLQALRPWAGAAALIVRGDGGRDWLATTLQAQGAAVQFVQSYRRVLPELTPAASAVLAQAKALPDRHLWLFSSSEAVHNLPRLAPGFDGRAARALATHARIAQAAQAIGFGRVLQVLATPAAVAAALARSIQSPPP